MSDPAVARVRIDTPGVTVEIEAAEPVSDLAEKALDLFHRAGGWPQHKTGSVGFAVTERRPSLDAQPSSMPAYPHPYPVQARGVDLDEDLPTASD